MCEKGDEGMVEGKRNDMGAGDISTLVFRRVMREDAGEISFDSKMLATFMELDGRKSLAAVARNTGQKMSALRESVAKLLRLKLIEPVTSAISLVDSDFLDRLKRELSLAIGPLAEIVIEDGAGDLGHDLSRFPSQRAAELVELIGREIKREDKRVVFVQKMVAVIKEKGY
jgi:hypothetical protein